jgi:hypothetical protein
VNVALVGSVAVVALGGVQVGSVEVRELDVFGCDRWLLRTP